MDHRRRSQKTCTYITTSVCSDHGGIGTVLADDPMLNARIEHGNDPIRVICDSNLRISEGSNIVKTAREIPTIIATISKDQEKIAKLEQKDARS